MLDNQKASEKNTIYLSMILNAFVFFHGWLKLNGYVAMYQPALQEMHGLWNWPWQLLLGERNVSEPPSDFGII
jgi:hypothetical protein